MSEFNLDLDLNTMKSIADGQSGTARTRWMATAREAQLPPTGNWHNWLVCAGRGFGKTFLGAQWTWWESWTQPNTYTHVIAPTWDSDVVGVCFEGPAGLLKCTPPEIIATYNKGDAILTFTNGSVIRGFSAEKPARLRGPQCHRIWADELAAWMYLEETWDMAMMGMRLGEDVKAVITTTPRPVPKVIDLLKQAEIPNSGVVVTRGTTYDNEKNLSSVFFKKIVADYEGTTLGRQEIYAEVIDPEEMGVIKRSWWKLWPSEKKLPPFNYIIMSLDTAYSEKDRDKKTGSVDPSACSVWGLFNNPEMNDRECIMLLDSWQDWLGFPELLERIKKEREIAYGEMQQPLIKPIWGRPLIGLGGGRKPDLLLIEEKASGMSLIQSLAAEKIYAHGYNPGRESKLTRLHSSAPIFKHGLIYVPESHKKSGQPMGFATDLISQVCTFSGDGSTKHDDYVDTTTQAIRYLTDRNLITITAPPVRDIDAEEAANAQRRVHPYKR